MPLSNPADFQFSLEEPFYGRLFTRRSDLTNDIRLLTQARNAWRGLFRRMRRPSTDNDGLLGDSAHSACPHAAYANAMSQRIAWMTNRSTARSSANRSLPASSFAEYHDLPEMGVTHSRVPATRWPCGTVAAAERTSTW